MARFDRDQEKFNTGRLLAGIEADDSYSLEDILNEFGGWSNRKEPDIMKEDTPIAEPEAIDPVAQEPASEPKAMPLFDLSDILQDAQTEAVNPVEPESQPEPAKAPSRFRFINLDLSDSSDANDLISSAEQDEKTPVWSWTDRDSSLDDASESEDDAKSADDESDRTEKKRQPRARKKQSNQAFEPEIVETKKQPAVSPAAALRHYRNRSAFARLRTLFVLLLAIAAVLLTLSPLIQVEVFQLLGAAKSTPLVLLILMCLCAVACIDTILRGLTQLLTFRFGLDLLLTAAFAVCIVDSIVALNQLRIPYCAVICFGFFFSSWSSYLTCVGNIRSLRVVADGEDVFSVKVASEAWNGIDCAYKASDSAPDYVDHLEAPNRASNTYRLYVPFTIIASVVFSVVCYLRVAVPVVRMLTACLCASLPVCGFVCYSRPFALIATRLSRTGAALCGWRSAKLLGGDIGAVVCDRDLYPEGTVSINGVKVYNDFRLEQMLCYAATAISKSDSNLKPLFEQLAQEQGVRLSDVGSFRCYEGGGIGAEIRGDIVLVGSVGFMHLMGIRLPTGTNIRQAVYVAVNGMIAGVVAINYDPGTPVVSALQCAVRHRGVDIIGATRDFLISPAMLHAKFHIPTSRSAFPPVAERYRLSSMTAADAVDYAAVMSRNTLLPFMETIAGARSLKSTVTAGVAVNLFVGLFGLLLVFFLGLGGAIETASALNLLLFALIWTVPNLLITTWSNKY